MVQTGRTKVVVRVQPVDEVPKTWTFEDLEKLPEDVDWRRYEIVDGALVVSPPPELLHEFVIADIRNALSAAAPPGFAVLGSAGVRFDRSYRIPDIEVVRTSLRGGAGKYLTPADALLVVEVVSPGSVTTDRITKPAQYAAAGIAAYWRVETDPVSLTAYTLPAGASVYAEVGTWRPGETARLDVPFPVEIELDRLVAPG